MGLIGGVRKKKPAGIKIQKNVNPKPGMKYVSIKTGLRIPSQIRRYMEVLTPAEENAKKSSSAEISTPYNVVFDKKTFKIIFVDGSQLDPKTKEAIEYAVKTNINTMIDAHKNFIMRHWNGAIFIRIKKLVKTAGISQYSIPWHRDAHLMHTLGVRHKGFAVGAVYVNRPDMPGGEIMFARNSMRYGFAPPSGTSVTFMDDEIFHKVTPVIGPIGVDYVPRSAFFFIYGTSENSFKMGLSESHIGERNYEKFYREIGQNYRNILNKPRNSISNNERRKVNEVSSVFFNNPNAKYNNTKTLYNNLKKTFNASVVPTQRNTFVTRVRTFTKPPLSVRRKLAQLVPENPFVLRRKLVNFMNAHRNMRERRINNINTQLRAKYPRNFTKLNKMKNAINRISMNMNTSQVNINRLKANGFSDVQAKIIINLSK
jgi:hypothetical protein